MSLDETLLVEQTLGFDAPVVGSPITASHDSSFVNDASSAAEAAVIVRSAELPVATWVGRIIAKLSGGSIFRKSILARWIRVLSVLSIF